MYFAPRLYGFPTRAGRDFPCKNHTRLWRGGIEQEVAYHASLDDPSLSILVFGQVKRSLFGRKDECSIDTERCTRFARQKFFCSIGRR